MAWHRVRKKGEASYERTDSFLIANAALHEGADTIVIVNFDSEGLGTANFESFP